MRRTPYLPHTEAGLVLRDPAHGTQLRQRSRSSGGPLTMGEPAARGLASGGRSTGAMTVEMRARGPLYLTRHIQLPELPPCACGPVPESTDIAPRARAPAGHSLRSRNSLAGRTSPEGRNHPVRDGDNPPLAAAPSRYGHPATRRTASPTPLRWKPSDPNRQPLLW
jgi:hypothetical protein